MNRVKMAHEYLLKLIDLRGTNERYKAATNAQLAETAEDLCDVMTGIIECRGWDKEDTNDDGSRKIAEDMRDMVNALELELQAANDCIKAKEAEIERLNNAYAAQRVRNETISANLDAKTAAHKRLEGDLAAIERALMLGAEIQMPHNSGLFHCNVPHKAGLWGQTPAEACRKWLEQNESLIPKTASGSEVETAQEKGSVAQEVPRETK